MYEQEMRVATPDGEMTTFVAHPDGDGPFPIAVLYMDGVGYRDQIKTNARRFAADGYYCVAPDLFYRSGEKLTFDFSRMSDEAYRARLMSIVASVKPDAVVADTEAIFDAIAEDVSRPDFRGCPFNNAAAEAPAGDAQRLAIKEYRDWLRCLFAELAARTGVADSEALIVLYDGALASAEMGGAAPRH